MAGRQCTNALHHSLRCKRPFSSIIVLLLFYSIGLQANETDSSLLRASDFLFSSIICQANQSDTFCLALSYKPPFKQNPLYSFEQNTGFTYDNALLMMVLLLSKNEPDKIAARRIGDFFIKGMIGDPENRDGRLRNAYNAVTPLSPQNNKINLPGWKNSGSGNWMSGTYELGSYTGEMCWVILAWLNYMDITGDMRYKEAAINLAMWIHNNCFDTSGFPGYRGGYSFGKKTISPEMWKSTEHNIDAYVAFSRIYWLTRDSTWLKRAIVARSFVLSMWDNKTNHFWTGTDQNGGINLLSPLDVQAWGFMGLKANRQALEWAEKNCSISIKGFTGFHFRSEKKNGIWWEGTAQMACAYKIAGNKDLSKYYQNELLHWQQISKGDRKGGIIATYPDKIFTGFYREGKPWNYYPRYHVGATAWFVFALKGYNPFWNEFSTKE